MTLRIVRRTLLDFIKHAIRKDDPRSRSNGTITFDMLNDLISDRGNQRVSDGAIGFRSPAYFLMTS